ncbi:MAG: hypothetical protein PHZ25_01500 [Candidatus Pacebacteria bacterium]|nr:hypothetical protein [Candidatus Paceibacterota bacterium]
MTIKGNIISFRGIRIEPEFFYPNMEEVGWTLKPKILNFEIKIIDQNEEKEEKKIDGRILAILKHRTDFPTGQILASVLIRAGKQIPEKLINIPIYFPDTIWIDDEGAERSPFIFCSDKEKKQWSMKWYYVKEYCPEIFAIVEKIFVSPI